MHLQFLIEDYSGAELIEALMKKLIQPDYSATYNCKYFKGLGGFTKKNTVKETKTGKLLNDLATYLRGFNKSLQGIDAAIIIVLDNDTRDRNDFLNELKSVADENNITIDHVFCLAIEELEAWLLGDQEAILAAYPNAKRQILSSYVQDSICGTWEILAEAIYPGGYMKMKKDCPTYMEVGKWKSLWAKNIGRNMTVEENKSQSFNFFINEINKRIIPSRC